jgi:prefoldin alpha subunit
MNEEEMRQAIGTIEYYKAQLESLTEQQQIIHYSLEENLRAVETLKEIGHCQTDSEILVPVGGSSFVYARVASNEKVLVGLGSGVSVEKDIDDALQTLDARVEELRESAGRIDERRSRIEQEHAKLSQMVQEAYQKLQESEG